MGDINVAFIVQARLGSTRLPAKVILPFYRGESIIDVILSKLDFVKGKSKIILATSTDPINDRLVDKVKSRSIVFRGSENDVLGRFIEAAEFNGVDRIIRICSDNPFIDEGGLKQLFEVAHTSSSDYVGFMINGKPSIQTHFGFWAEFATLDALKRVVSITDEPLWHEHVTNYIYCHPGEFNIEWLSTPSFINGRNDIRLTIDTIEDFNTAKDIYASLKKDGNYPSLEDVVSFLDIHSEYLNKMKKQIYCNKK